MTGFLKTLKNSYIEGRKRKAAYEIAYTLKHTNKDFKHMSIPEICDKILNKS